jgi:hypothetical protein
MKGYIEYVSREGFRSWVPRYNKHEDYCLAEAWLKSERETLKTMHGQAYLFINIHTLEYIAGVSHNSCARGWRVLFTNHTHDSHILAVQL